MNKKVLLITSLAFLGLISILMPWFTYQGYSLTAISEEFQDGYIIGAFFIAILAITLYSSYKKTSGKKATIAVIILALITAILSIYEIVLNKKLLDFGASIGIGAFIAILTSGFIVIYTIYSIKTESSNTEITIDKEKILEITKKIVTVVIAIIVIIVNAIKSIVIQVNKEIEHKKANKPTSDEK